jgi:hypothetical protein
MAEFVYIIESPSAKDIYDHKYESDMLRQAVQLNNIRCDVRIAVSKETFERAINEGLRQAIDANYPLDPILHISAHGCEEGIQLTNNEFVTWDELKNLLLPISRYRGWGLLLCMSACQGIQARKMAFTERTERHEPFYAVVGNSGEPTWSETAVAYASFYHLLSKGFMLVDAVEAMKIASANKDFQILLAFVEKNDKLFPRKNEDAP